MKKQFEETIEVAEVTPKVEKAVEVLPRQETVSGTQESVDTAIRDLKAKYQVSIESISVYNNLVSYTLLLNKK